MVLIGVERLDNPAVDLLSGGLKETISVTIRS